jgi:transglutaminase-like putative cysteine protease
MRDQNGLRRLLSGILLIVLVHEWMRPVSELSNWTDVYSIAPILITIAGVLTVDVLKIPPIWTRIVKLFIILSAVAAMFHGTNLLHLDWWINFSILIMNDLLNILMGQWDAVSAECRTLLFIGAWATVVCWLYLVILYQRIALYITILTVVYLLILQMWLGLDTTKGVIIAVIVGLLLHGLSVLPVMESMFGLKAKLPGWPVRWMMSSIVLVCITVGCGLLLSMGQERTTIKLPLMKWNWEPLEALTSFSMQNFPGYSDKQKDKAHRSGYSLNDTMLGGSVKSDDSIAFLANTEQPDAYWRGESKTVYNGKGWSNLANDFYGYEFGSVLPDVLSDLTDSSLPNNSMIIQEVFPLPDYPTNDSTTILLSSGAIRRVDRVVPKNGTSISVGTVTIDRIEGKFTIQGSGPSSLTSYRVQSSVPLTSESAKQMMVSWVGEEPVPAAISVPNLQLPEQLPERISHLAQFITDEFDSNWEKANAIEQYLHTHYRYTLTPKKLAQEGDFVDLFLFEQQEGYCDYFSTAMAVMLRSIGIPARWVKGYSPGEIIDAEEYGFLYESSQRLLASQVRTHTVMIRNRNAHSWVEVYLSGIGWTSFDPTPGSLVAITRGPEVEVSSSAAEDEATHPMHKHISSVIASLSVKRIQYALLWIASIVIFWQVGRMIFKSSLIQSCFEVIHIRVLMIKYVWGLTTNQADTRILERILRRTLTRYGHLLHLGETLRESVVRSSFPVTVMEPLLELLSLYELARYGPLQRRRIPYDSILASWRILH